MNNGERPPQRYWRGSFRAVVRTVIGGSVSLALVTVIEPHLMFVGLVTMFVLGALPFALLFDVFSARANSRKMQFSIRELLVVITCLALYLSLLWEPWTFHLRFAISRPALERLAADVERGASPGPQWAGLFYIKKADRNETYGKPYTVLWTEPEGGSPSGFVHPAPERSGGIPVTFEPHRPGPVLFNDYSTAFQRNLEWFYFIQD